MSIRLKRDDSPERWYLLRNDEAEPEGPCTAADLRLLLASGEIDAEARVNPVGTGDWFPIDEALGRSAARGGIASTTRAHQKGSSGGRGGMLTYVGIAASALIAIEVPLLWFLHTKEARAMEDARIEARRLELEEEAERRKEEEARSEVLLVDVQSTTKDCFATDTLVTCYLTSFAPGPVTTCVQGLLQQKEAAGVRLYSMPFCSGPIQPHQTVSVSAPWSSGRAKDLCHNARGYLDWDKCEFTVIGYRPEGK